MAQPVVRTARNYKENKELSFLTRLLIQPDRQTFCFADVFVIFSGWVFTEEVFKGGIPLGIDNYLF